VSGLQLGRLAALAQVGFTIAYFATGLWWLQSRPPGSNPFAPSDPFLAVLECLIILSAIAFIFIAAAAVGAASESRRVVASAGLAFAMLFAAFTCGAHFVQLTVLPRSPAPIVTWPSVPMALDLLGWDLFFGASLVCIAFATSDDPSWPARLFLTAGILCIAGISAPLSAQFRLHLFATLGYAVLFPFACLQLWRRTRPV
jgi:hypothetical protein